MTPNLSLKQIEALQMIAKSGSMTAAAARLNVTPAALTARLKSLETELGAALFNRTSSGLRPTAAGEAALAAAERVQRAVTDFADAVETVRKGTGGRLSVAAISTAKYFAPRMIVAFKELHPGLELRFLIGNRAETMALLRDYDVDIALTGRPAANLPVERIAIGPHPYVMIAPPFHRFVGRTAIPKSDLAGETFLFREEGSGSRTLFDYYIGDIPVRLAQIGIELGSNETIKQAVMAGLGIALISAHTVAVEVADGRLACLDVAGLPIIRQWYLAYRPERELSSVALAFRDFVRDRGAEFLPKLPEPGGG